MKTLQYLEKMKIQKKNSHESLIDDHDSKEQNFIDVIVILSRTKKHLSHIIFSISYAIISNDSKVFAIHINITTTKNNSIQ